MPDTEYVLILSAMVNAIRMVHLVKIYVAKPILTSGDYERLSRKC